MVIKRVQPLSAAKIQGILGVCVGLLAGAMFSLFGLIAGSIAAGADESGGALAGMLFGVGAIIVLPIFYGVLGFIGGAIGAFIYNMAAGWVGGLEIDTQ
jgi:hypothetical protein